MENKKDEKEIKKAGTVSGSAEEKTAKTAGAKKPGPYIAVVMILCVLIGACAGIYVYKDYNKPERKVERAIAQLESGEVEEALALLEGIETEETAQLRLFAEIEKDKQKIDEVLAGMKIENGLPKGTEELAESVKLSDDSAFIVAISDLFGNPPDESKYSLLPESLKSKLIYYSFSYSMMPIHGSHFISDKYDKNTMLEEEYNSHLESWIDLGIHEILKEEALGLNVKETINEALSKFDGVRNKDVFGKDTLEFIDTLGDGAFDELEKENEDVLFMLVTRDMTYYLLTGKTIDAE